MVEASRPQSPSPRLTSDEISSDVQNASVKSSDLSQLTLGFIEGITEVEIIYDSQTDAPGVCEPEIESDNCHRRVRVWETRKSSQREIMWLLHGLRI